MRHWLKCRLSCPASECPSSFTEDHRSIAAPRQGLTHRAGRWATEQVGRHGRSVNEVAGELACDWHTVNDTVVSYGEALLDRRYRPLRRGRAPSGSTRSSWSGSVPIVPPALLDPARRRPSRTAARHRAWSQQCRGPMGLAGRTGERASASHVQFGTLGPVGPLPKRLRGSWCPHATLVADPFHVAKLANYQARRVPPAGPATRLLGHRGQQVRPSLPVPDVSSTMAQERLDEQGHTRS